ncbi:hypothetical protein trd_A0790 (plasmid) [Thermomicrobium roseum DSM 5159]|uniref:Uncharacterized protein n=1 Tax=Thermomicrobium roseum (strain ATCC 27502 / DSM 5159 / P-2) TaxID=309801 RepID=B9L4S6_THERP|nr:hypothetical protein trd_A0790 [Thermomicrobium roseum DSM 5159]
MHRVEGRDGFGATMAMPIAQQPGYGPSLGPTVPRWSLTRSRLAVGRDFGWTGTRANVR